MNDFNKQIIIVTVILLSIAGISYANFLSQYGLITGTANNVSAPEFYVGSIRNGETLLVNEKSPNCIPFSIENTYRTFKTRDLGGVNFNYIPKINFQIRAKGMTVSTSSSPILGLAFGYYDGAGTPQYLASATVPLGNAVINYSFSNISASQKPTDVHSFFYEFTKICSSDDNSCSISIDKCDENGFYTKVKLSK